MKATLSCVAVLLFAALANSVPVTKVEKAIADITASDSSSDPNSSVVNNIFTTVSVSSNSISLPNGTTVAETCNVTTVTDMTTFDTVITSLCVPDTASNGDGSVAQGLGVAIVSTGTISQHDLSVALGNQGNANTDSGDSAQGIGAVIIGNGSIPANQVGQAGAGGSKATLKRRWNTFTNVLTPEGSVVENCHIQLTPESTGQFTEAQTCEVSLQPNITDANHGEDNGAAPSSPVEPSSVAVTPSIVPDVSSSSSSSSSASVPPAATPTPAPPVSTTSVPVPSSPSPVSDSSPGSDGANIMGTSVTSLELPSVSPTVPPISAAEDNTTSAFTMPGRQISILPVGLAVFAGVSVIALIVVGVVTYERTKYRKNFRNRKLAEQMKAKADVLSERSMV